MSESVNCIIFDPQSPYFKGSKHNLKKSSGFNNLADIVLYVKLLFEPSTVDEQTIFFHHVKGIPETDTALSLSLSAEEFIEEKSNVISRSELLLDNFSSRRAEEFTKEIVNFSNSYNRAVSFKDLKKMYDIDYLFFHTVKALEEKQYLKRCG